MKVSNKQKIGTYFKKENIFLATVSSGEKDTIEALKEKSGGIIPECIIKALVMKGFLKFNQYDIFYKDEKGYTRFVEEGPETFVGDNSDGKGIIRNVVPVWNYYSEDDLFEAMINDSFMAICDCSSNKALERYNTDYNK